MFLSRLIGKAQTTIPRQVCDALGLKEGDHIRYLVEGTKVTLAKLVPPVVSDEQSVIPQEVRTALGLQEGDRVSYALENDKVVLTRVPAMNCSFCGKAIAQPEPPQPGAPRPPKLAVAGPRVFICRDCVGLCISVMAESDPEWRDDKIAHLAGFATGETQVRMQELREEMVRRLAAAGDVPVEPDAASTDQGAPPEN
jgi:bifunctional DNA-binding transcriptional regulator/antitoxin component of YhaV-PrlF toxin-antitoxin module